jgi:basic amino acid/polyamine antiporter, APA family
LKIQATTQKTPEVQRTIGPFTSTSIVVANMIGSGIFITSGFVAANVPNPGWVLVCWIFGGLIAISGALCYSELATRMPEEGGEYVYLKKLYHPILGFLSGWTSFFVGFSAPIAGSALGFAAYMFASLEQLFPDLTVFHILLIKKSLAVTIILIFTMIHYIGLRTGAKVQNILTVLKILIVAGLTVCGILWGKGSWANISGEIQNTTNSFAFGTAMMLVMFAYTGWNASAYIAGEIKNPRKTLPISLLAGTTIVILLYLALNLFIFYALPYSEIVGTEAIVEAASVKAFGNWMGKGLGLLIGFGLLSSMSAFIIIGPRVYFAMARDKLFFPFVSKVHPKYKVPSRSIMIQGVIASFMVIFSSIEQLVIYLAFALNIFSWLAIAGLFIARKKRIGEVSVVKTWGYPFIPIFYLSSSLTLAIFAFMNRPFESSIAIITVLVGIPFYFLWKRKFA